MTPRPHPERVRLEVRVRRKSPTLPPYAVVPDESVRSWEIEGTTTIEGTVDGADLGRRSLKRWDDDRWFVEFPAALARSAGFDAGDRVHLELWPASVRLPEELEALFAEEPRARDRWERLTASGRRMLREHVLAAKRSETRTRRARRALLGPDAE